MAKFSESQYWHAAIGLPQQVYAGQTLSIVEPNAELHLPYLQQNLALHVGDQASKVQQRRMALLNELSVYGAKRLCWLNQTHSTQAYYVDDQPNIVLQDGDALVTQEQGVALMMMTADCLPIVISNAEGSEVACVHAGWRGLADGVIESAVQLMETSPAYAWIGAAISQRHFEVGAEVKVRFESLNARFADYFIQGQNEQKYFANLYGIAIQKLLDLCVKSVTGADRCSFAESDAFYSYRRNPHTGRMATFVFIQPSC